MCLANSRYGRGSVEEDEEEEDERRAKERNGIRKKTETPAEKRKKEWEEQRENKEKWEREQRRGKDEGRKKEIGHIKGSLGHGGWYLTQIHIFHSDGRAT